MRPARELERLDRVGYLIGLIDADLVSTCRAAEDAAAQPAALGILAGARCVRDLDHVVPLIATMAVLDLGDFQASRREHAHLRRVITADRPRGVRAA